VAVQPTATSYEGKAVDITGMELDVRYADNPDTFVRVTNLSAYGVYPKYTQRNGTGTGGLARGQYAIFAMGDGQPVYAGFDVNVSNLLRKDPTSGDRPANTSPILGDESSTDSDDYWAQGVQLTADLGSYRKTYRVDEYPDFSNMKLQGDYEDGTRQEIPLSRDMRWEIRPLYTNGNLTGRGLLIVSVGGTSGQSLWGTNSASGYAPSLEAGAKGVQVGVPLDAVYHVTGIKLANPEAVTQSIGNFYYWDRDDPASWLSTDGTGGRAKDAQLEISYSDGSTRTISAAEAVRQNTVWYNLNPAANERPLTVAGIHETVTKVDNLKTLWPNHRAPRIAFYYRGYWDYLSVPVYTRFTGITVTINDGGDSVAANMKHSDNDYRGFTAQDFANAITVTATYTAFSDSSLPAANLVLAYQGIRPYYAYNPDTISVGADPTTVPTGSAYDTEARNVAALGKPFRDLGGGTLTWDDWRKVYYERQYTDSTLTTQGAYDPSTVAGSRYPIPRVQGNFATTSQGVRSGMKVTQVLTDGTLDSSNDWPLPAGQGSYIAQADMRYDGGPLVYTTNFGDPDYTWDQRTRSWKLGQHAWGESSVPGNNGRTRNVTVYYAVAAKPKMGVTANSSVRNGRVPTYWTNIQVK